MLDKEYDLMIENLNHNGITTTNTFMVIFIY